jgi:hypothetical protein
VVGLANYDKLSVIGRWEGGLGTVTVGYNDVDFFEKIKMDTKLNSATHL